MVVGHACSRYCTCCWLQYSMQLLYMTVSVWYLWPTHMAATCRLFSSCYSPICCCISSVVIVTQVTWLLVVGCCSSRWLYIRMMGSCITQVLFVKRVTLSDLRAQNTAVSSAHLSIMSCPVASRHLLSRHISVVQYHATTVAPWHHFLPYQYHRLYGTFLTAIPQAPRFFGTVLVLVDTQ